jgi:hypothetical protein
MKHHYIDMSRSLFQGGFTSKSKGGALCEFKPCSDIYSFGNDRMLVGREFMALQGHSKRMNIGNVSDKTLQLLACRGTAVPCLGFVMWSFVLTREIRLNSSLSLSHP